MRFKLSLFEDERPRGLPCLCHDDGKCLLRHGRRLLQVRLRLSLQWGGAHQLLLLLLLLFQLQLLHQL